MEKQSGYLRLDNVINVNLYLMIINFMPYLDLYINISVIFIAILYKDFLSKYSIKDMT
jgi:hypothetical protein